MTTIDRALWQHMLVILFVEAGDVAGARAFAARRGRSLRRVGDAYWPPALKAKPTNNDDIDAEVFHRYRRLVEIRWAEKWQARRKEEGRDP